MPKNDEGEFELVLGNRQLISVFLIVVILLGVFFSMGYIVGRNSSGAASETARNEKSSPDTQTDSAEADGSNPEAPADQPSGPPAANATAPPTAPPESTKPEQPAPLPPAAKAEAAKKEPVKEPVKEKETRSKEAKPAEIKPKPSPSPPPARPVERPAAAGQPSGGQYWQVVATSRPDAEIIAEALDKKGFHVVLAPAPKDGVFRVLVGPLADAAMQAQTRTGLESAGFKNPIMRKY